MSKKSEIKELVEVLSSLTECSHCKEKITVKSLYCHHCGTKQKTSEIQRQCFCIHCGKKIELDSTFCSFCGKHQKNNGNVLLPYKKKEKKIKDKKKKKNQNTSFLCALFYLIFVFFKNLIKEAYRGGYKLMHGRYPKK